MFPILSALLAFVAGLFLSRASLCLEHLALRHQLAVYKQTVYRPRLCPADRLFWVWLSRFWSGWHDALVFVQPRTVLAWQQKRFREHWRRLSQRKQLGRPAIALPMLVPLFIMLGGYQLYFGWLLCRRLQGEILRRERSAGWLEEVA